MQKFIQGFNKVYSKALALELETKMEMRRNFELHPSSFPYCGLRHAHEIIMNGTKRTRHLQGSGKFFTSIGTTLHEIIQEYIAKIDDPDIKIVGDWRCQKCKKRKIGTKPPLCTPTCKVKYHEIGVEYKKWTKGQIDLVLEVIYKNKKYIIVVDFKTTSSKKILAHKSKAIFPYTTNKKQIESYCGYLASPPTKYNVLGYMLVYISRDNPFLTATVGKFVDIEKLKKDNARMEDHFGRVMKLNSSEVGYLADNKVCTDFDYYEKNIKDQYNPCPLASICFNGRIKDTVTKLYRKNRHNVTDFLNDLNKYKIRKASKENEKKGAI
jgi:hypothetical protein